MSVVKSSYSISKIKKLIDLNHDMINFKVDFKLSSPEGKKFQALIVDQTTLDTIPNDELEYKTIDTSLEGDIVADKNVYQNYYIILKSEEPMSVDVELLTTKMPDYIESEPAPEKQVKKSEDITDNNTTYIIIGLCVIIAFIFILSMYKSNNNFVGLPQKRNVHKSLLNKLSNLNMT